MSDSNISANKERFLQLYKTYITREGADKLLEYLCSPKCDFFTAPASTRFHGSYEGGLLEHSLNVYDCLKHLCEDSFSIEKFGFDFSDETIALVSLLHDICKTNVYISDFRNVKDENGVWQKVPTYRYDDHLPYGHGEKSVYMISGFMRLTRDEAFAIRYHMGFSGEENKTTIGNAMNMFPLAAALNIADMEASFFIEGRK